MKLGPYWSKVLPLRCVRRFKLFVGSSKTSGSKVRHRKPQVGLMGKPAMAAFAKNWRRE